MNLKPYLEDIERRINPEEEERLEREWLAFADGKCTDPFFSPKREISRPTVDYPVMLINDAFKREDWMVYHQLKLVSEMDAHWDEMLDCVRKLAQKGN